MYYISKTNELGLSRMVEKLSDFGRASRPEEGSEWVVRKKRNVSTFDALPVYVWKNGKLNKTTKDVIVF